MSFGSFVGGACVGAFLVACAIESIEDDQKQADTASGVTRIEVTIPTAEIDSLKINKGNPLKLYESFALAADSLNLFGKQVAVQLKSSDGHITTFKHSPKIPLEIKNQK